MLKIVTKWQSFIFSILTNIPSKKQKHKQGPWAVIGEAESQGLQWAEGGGCPESRYWKQRCSHKPDSVRPAPGWKVHTEQLEPTLSPVLKDRQQGS